MQLSKALFMFSFLVAPTVCLAQVTEMEAIADGETKVVDAPHNAAADMNVYQNNGGSFTLENQSQIVTQSGSGVFLNGEGNINAVILNQAGAEMTTDSGYAIGSKYHEGKAITAKISNAGLLERIDLDQATGSSLANDATGRVSGTVKLGETATLSNWGQMDGKIITDLSGISQPEKSENVISLRKNGTLLNGVSTALTTEGVVTVRPAASAAITTDRISFTQWGRFFNGGTVDNKSVSFSYPEPTAGVYYEFYNLTDAYAAESVAAASFKTQEFNMVSGTSDSQQNVIYNMQGGSFSADKMTVGNFATLTNGGAYDVTFADGTAWKLEGTQTTVDSEQVDNPVVNKTAQMTIGTGVFGDQVTFNNVNAAALSASSLSFGQNTVFTNEGGVVSLAAPTGSTMSAGISFADGAAMTISSFDQENETLDPSTGDITSQTVTKIGALTADHLTFTNQGSLTLTGGAVTLKTLTMGTGANISGSAFESEATQIDAVLQAAEGIFLDDGSSLTAEGMAVKAPQVVFAKNGVFTNSSTFDVAVLTMDNNATVNNSAVMTGATILGSDSVVNLTDGENQAGSIRGGVTKAAGATNVVINAGASQWDAYINGGSAKNSDGTRVWGVDVDEINVNSGVLRVAGNIGGVVNMASGTTLSVYGETADLRDEVKRQDGADNTTLSVYMGVDPVTGAVIGSGTPGVTYWTPLNEVDVNTLAIHAGGVNLQRQITVDSVVLDSNTVLRLEGNYVVGDISENQNEAVNTTLALAPGAGREIDTSGTVTLDRVIVENGTFNVRHALAAMPGSEAGQTAEGVELGDDATIHFWTDSHISRLVRLQDTPAFISGTKVYVHDANLTVAKDTDIDHLYLDRAHVTFANSNLTSNIKIASGVTVGDGSVFEASGTLDIWETGQLTVEKGGLLAVSQEPIADMTVQSLTVLNDVWLKSGSTLSLRTDALGRNDFINVTNGAVTIEGGTKLIVRDVQAGKKYDLIYAVAGIHGSPLDLKTSFLWEGVNLSLQNDTLSLQVDNVKSFAQGFELLDPTPNQKAMAAALDQIRTDAGASVPAFVDDLMFASSFQEASDIIRGYSPEGYLNTPLATARTVSLLTRDTQEALSEMRRAYQAVPKVRSEREVARGWRTSRDDLQNRRSQAYRQALRRTDKGGLWAKPVAAKVSQDDVDRISGYELTTYGVTAGIDHSFGDIALGLGGVFASGEMETNDSLFKSDMTTYGGGVYGAWLPRASRHFLDFYAYWLQNKHEATRQSGATKAEADYDIEALTAGLSFGHEFVLSEQAVIIPQIGVEWTQLKTDDIEEKSSDAPVLLNVKTDTMQSIQTPLQVRLRFKIPMQGATLTPELKARYAHEFGDVNATARASFQGYAPVFEQEGLEAERDLFTLGAVIGVNFSDASRLFFKYDFDYTSSLDGHSVKLGYKWTF